MIATLKELGLETHFSGGDLLRVPDLLQVEAIESELTDEECSRYVLPADFKGDGIEEQKLFQQRLLFGDVHARRQQHDLCSPDVLLRAVPVGRNRRKLPTISRADFHYDPCTHGADSHPYALLGSLTRAQAPDFIH